MYASLKDGENSMVAVSSGMSQGRITQTGEFEGELLCAQCDNSILGRYETYASKLINGKSPIPGLRIELVRSENGDVEYAQFNGVDYNSFRLFLDSIIWRASISSREFFKEVSLEVAAEERLRFGLFTGNAGKYSKFPCVIYIPRAPEILWGITKSPIPVKHGFQFLVAGTYYDFYSRNENAEIPKKCTIREDGTMKILFLPPKVVQRLENQIKQRLSD